MNTHIINRQVIDLNVKSKENAFAIQQRVREVYFSEVVPLLDEVLSSMTPAGEILYIDRLEVDLGVLSYEHLSKEMKEIIRRKILDQLNEQVRMAGAENPAMNEGKDNAAVLKTEATSTLELLRIFFTTGSIPWWADDEQAPPDVDELIGRLLEREPGPLLTLLREVIVHPIAAKRVFLQVDKKVQKQLLALLPQKVVEQVQDMLQRLTALSGSDASTLSGEETEQLIFIVAATVYAQMSGISERDAQALILRSLVAAMPAVISDRTIRLIQKIYRSVLVALISDPKRAVELSAFVHYFEEWEQAEPGHALGVTADTGLSVAMLVKKNITHAKQRKLDKAIAVFLGHAEGKRSASKQAKKKRMTESTSKRSASASGEDAPVKRAEDSADNDDELAPLPEEILALLEPGEPVFNQKEESHIARTRYAGLVLIAPFLPAFFEEMQLLEDGSFRNESARHKAIHFLNFMATNQTKAPEYSLVLHKILCEAELKDPVPKSMKLNADEQKAALLFLDDIAEQWTTLQGTSGEAFRETFMRRNGIIEQRVNALLLRIERAPMDVLLDTLPWNISIIRLPWMQQLLHVEW